MELIKQNTKYAFIGNARRFAMVSSTLVILSVGLLVGKGLNFGIDFQGGTEMLFSFEKGEAPTLTDLREVIEGMGYKGSSIQTFGSDGNQVMVRVREVSSLDAELVTKFREATEAKYGDELIEYELKASGGLVRVALKAPKLVIAPAAPAAPAGGNTISLGEGGPTIDLSKMGKGGGGQGFQFKIGDDGKMEQVPMGGPEGIPVAPQGVPSKDRIVLAQDKDAVPVDLGNPGDPPPPNLNPIKIPTTADLEPLGVSSLAPQLGADKRAELKKHFEALGMQLAGDIEMLRGDGRNEYRIGFQGVAATVSKELAKVFPQASVRAEGIYYVGPQVGEQLRNEGVLSVIYALLGILIYIVFRFDFTFAPGAIVALVHDVLITIGVFSLFSLKFDLPIIAALLTIVGYSLNDTIVVYDRIREELGQTPEGVPLAETVNRAINLCLSRTMLTSATTLIVVGILWAFGGPMIREFAIAMTIGVVVGTYSSMFVASPLYIFLVGWWEARQEALESA
jgi:preprotein translocase subunit SecF